MYFYFSKATKQQGLDDEQMFFRLLFAISLLTFTRADYECVCNYNVELEVKDHDNGHGATLGYMYEFDCKPKVSGSEHATMYEIMFEGKIGFVSSEGGNVQSQTCPGAIAAVDLVTTTMKTTRQHTKTTITSTAVTTSTTTTTTTTPKPTTITTTTTPTPSTTTTTTPKPTSTTTTTTTPQPTTTTTTTTPTPTTTTTTTPKPTTTTTTTTPLPTTTTTTTTTTTPKPTTTPTTTTTSTTPMPTTTTSLTTTFKASPIPTSSVPALTEGRIDLCPSHVKGDVNIFGGYLGQYGEYCLELVLVKTQWHNAQRHCQVAGHGSLIDVQDTFKQDYIVRFLANHTNVESIWLGLTDSEKEGAIAEGKWTWVSGNLTSNLTSYNNFGPNYNGHSGATHKLNDCVIMKQGGEWTDVSCGVPLVLGTGFGEAHNFICQYNLTSKPINIFHELGTALVG